MSQFSKLPFSTRMVYYALGLVSLSLIVALVMLAIAYTWLARPHNYQSEVFPHDEEQSGGP